MSNNSRYTPEEIARLLKKERMERSRGIRYSEFAAEHGVDLTMESVGDAYRRLFGYPISRAPPYFPKIDRIPREGKYTLWGGYGTDASLLARRGLLKGVKLGDNIFVDISEWYRPVKTVSMKKQVPLWYLMHLEENGTIVFKKIGRTSYMNEADVRKADRMYHREKWMILAKASRDYDTTREGMSYIVGRRKPNRYSRTIPKTIEYGRNVYVSGRDLRIIMRQIPRGSAVSRGRAVAILGNEGFRILQSSGKLVTTRRGNNEMVRASSIHEYLRSAA